MKALRWTNEEDQYLRDNYPKGDIKDIYTHLDRSMSAIKNRVNVLNLKRQVPNAGRFPSGHIPANKGTKGMMGANKTSFKKGHIPHNAKHSGKPYLYKRTRKNGHIERVWLIHLFAQGLNRLSYTKWLWEKEFGKLKPGQVVTFKDGFIEDRPPVIEDLKVITLKDNLARNTGIFEVNDKYATQLLKKSNIENPPQELIDLKRNHIKLNRKLKQLENGTD